MIPSLPATSTRPWPSSAGGIEVYAPGSSHPLGRLAGAPGHWNSPIVVDGHVVEPEGDANDHELTGTLELFSIR